MLAISRSERGFSLLELMMVIAVAGTLMVIAVPVMTDLSESSKLSTAVRELEREYQGARMSAVKANRALRVRLNCPTNGYYRTVEVLGTAADTATDRCLLTNYPYPATDTNLVTRPNYDGPVQMLPHGATVAGGTLEFRPDGTVYQVVSGTLQPIATTLITTVTRNGESRTVVVNGAGRIRLQ